MDIVEFKTSLSNWCPLDWFKTHAITIGERQTTIIWQMCHVTGGGTQLATFTKICLL